jgi:uncharacterized surface protein with fasciclin (FAS1) repeats
MIEPSSTEKSLASMLLAAQAAHLNLPGRTSPIGMQDVSPYKKAATLSASGDVIAFSWKSMPSGDIASKLTQLIGPCVQDMDLATRALTKSNEKFSKFIAAAESQGVMEMLKGPGPFTLLVPLDSGVHGEIDAAAHVLVGKLSKEDLVAGGSAQTLAGNTVKYDLYLNNCARVGKKGAQVKGAYNAADHYAGTDSSAYPFDVDCTNGYIHAIDMALEGGSGGGAAPAARAAPAPAARPAPAPMGGGRDDMEGAPAHLRDALERKRAKQAASGAPAPAPARAPVARSAPLGEDVLALPIPMDGSFGKDPYQTPEQEAATARYVRWINSNKHGYDCKDGVNYVNTGVPPKMGPPRDMEAQYLAWINSNKHGYDCTDGMKVVWKAGGGIPKAYDTEERWHKSFKSKGIGTRR